MDKVSDQNTDKGLKPVLNVGSRTCQCAACGLFFGGVKAFDRHQVEDEEGEIMCRTPEQMREKGMVLNPNGVWGLPMSKKWLEGHGRA